MPADIPIPLLDAVAVAFFLLLFLGYRLALHSAGLRGRSIIGAMIEHRTNWMLNMSHRDNRLMDAVLLTNLSQGNAFFASTAAIAIGGLITVLGYGDRARGFFESVPHAAAMSPLLWLLKVSFLIAIFVYAFFKFAWAFRLTHYAAVMIGATPALETSTAAEREAHALRSAALNTIMAEHAASGLSAFYYAIAALAWFFHPVLFMLATAWVVAILVRRDFFSRSRLAIAGEDPCLSEAAFARLRAEPKNEPERGPRSGSF